MSKTLLLLGGSAAQVEAIDKARELGYRTVLCDYLSDNPGQRQADSFHLVSTTDREAVLEVARAEAVDGVVAYGSDPAAPTAAYVARELGLPGNPLQSVESLCDKAGFRALLRDGGFSCPGFFAVPAGTGADEIASAAEDLSAPFVVKPVDSSGSKGVSVVDRPEGLACAVDAALLRSRSKVAIVEEMVRPGRYGVVEAEVFVVEGVVRSWVLMRSVRGRGVNPLVPTISIHRPCLPDPVEWRVRSEIQRLVDAAGILNGPMNIEMMVGDGGEVSFIDVGPRNGGNMLARFASIVSGKDVVGATVRAAMGDVDASSVEYDGRPGCRWVQHILGSATPGTLCGLRKGYLESESLVELHMFNRIGDEIPSFDDASGAVGIAFLRFSESCSDEEIASFVEEPCVVGSKSEGEVMRAEGLIIKPIQGEEELRDAWSELGKAYDPPLWDTVDDYGSYLSKVAKGAVTLASFDGRRTVGGISFYANDFESQRAFVTQLMVLPEYQGMGVGTELLGACEEFLRSTPMKKLALEVRKMNRGAKRFYERFGFAVYDESPESYFMEKPLK